MKKNKLYYLLFIILLMFSFTSGVKGEELSGSDIGYGKTCSSLELGKNWLKSPENTGKDVSCLYAIDFTPDKPKDSPKSCFIVQINYNSDGSDFDVIENKSNLKTKEFTVDTSPLTTGTVLKSTLSSDANDIKLDGGCLAHIYHQGLNTSTIWSYNVKVMTRKIDGNTVGAINLKQKSGDISFDQIKPNETIDEYEERQRKEHDWKSWWGKDYEKLSCEELIGDELKGYIQQIVNIIKIVVPILLIVFGTIDFGKAIFVNDEGEMKKSQTKFIKRLIIAVAFFLVPTLLTLILNIAHNIWPSIEASLCGITF